MILVFTNYLKDLEKKKKDAEKSYNNAIAEVNKDVAQAISKSAQEKSKTNAPEIIAVSIFSNMGGKERIAFVRPVSFSF